MGNTNLGDHSYQTAHSVKSNRKTAAGGFYRGLLAISVVLSAQQVIADKESVTLMDPVLVTATLTEVELRDAPAATTVITQEQIKQTAAKDLVEVLRDTTGISLLGRGVGNRRVINMRGMESHHTLILVDGRRVSASDAVVGHSDFKNNWAPIESIERIEVVRGPLSSLYGSEGMGGVINIITKKPEKEWSGSISVTSGERDDNHDGRESDLSFTVGGPLSEKLSISLDGEISNHDKTEDKDDPSISEAEGKEIVSGGFTLAYRLAPNHRIELQHSRVDEERPRDTLSRSRVLHESIYNLDRRMSSLEYRGDFTNTQMTMRLYQSSLDVENRTDNGVTPAVPQKLIDWVAEAHFSHALTETQLITAGAEYRQEELEHIMMAGGSDEINNKALFVQDEITLNHTLALTLGARLDDHELFGNEWSPRAYLVYELNNHIRIKGGYGEGFRAPTLKQISPNYRFEGFHTFVGNPDLDPETSKTGEISVQYYGNKIRAGLAFFRNEVEDLIQTNCIVNCSTRFGREFEYINVNEARIDGVEFDLSATLNPSFDLSFNLTHLDAENRTNGEELANRPKLSANTKLGWHSLDNSLSVSLRGQYIGEQYEDGNDLPDYSLWHFNLRKRINDTFSLRAGVDNIGNVRLGDKDENFSFEERGRFFYMGLDVSF